MKRWLIIREDGGRGVREVWGWWPYLEESPEYPDSIFFFQAISGWLGFDMAQWFLAGKIEGRLSSYSISVNPQDGYVRVGQTRFTWTLESE